MHKIDKIACMWWLNRGTPIKYGYLGSPRTHPLIVKFILFPNNTSDMC